MTSWLTPVFMSPGPTTFSDWHEFLSRLLCNNIDVLHKCRPTHQFIQHSEKKGLSWQAFWNSCWNFLNISRFAAALFSLNLLSGIISLDKRMGNLVLLLLYPALLWFNNRAVFFSLWENLKRKRIAARECWRQNLFGEKLRKDDSDSVRVSPGAYISKACGGRVSVVAL